jgi:AcrR family transcriptional regulator
LLERALEFYMQHGIGEISLRELAGAIGTSHRMLSYHFGSKQGLLIAVSKETERRQQLALAELAADSADADLASVSWRFWRRLRSPDLAPLERLFFELYGQALQGRPHAAPFLEGVVDHWVEPVVPAFVALGLPEAEARAEARLGLAVVRGLLLDVLATGDGEVVDAAFERFVTDQAARLEAAAKRAETS